MTKQPWNKIMDKYQGNARIFTISYPESMASSVSVSCCQVRRWGNGINIKRFDWLFMITRTESYLGMTTADWGDRWLWVQEWNIYWNRLAVSQGLLRMSTQFFKRHSLSYYQLAILKTPELQVSSYVWVWFSAQGSLLGLDRDCLNNSTSAQED